MNITIKKIKILFILMILSTLLQAQGVNQNAVPISNEHLNPT